MDENKYSIIAKNISKGYKMYSSPKQKLMDLILPKGAGKTFYALKDLSFKVEKGEVVGLLGLNGSGKSTLSNILGGVSMPTNGEIKINGESSLIAIGLGMNNFLTGIENIELKALMMGYKKDEVEAIKQDIIDFADIGEFINQPLRTYSSGMRSRLGFAISVYTNPDILVIDEALSVGDPTFTQKCLDKMNEFKDSGKTIFFVSHSLPQIKQFCNKAMWLEYGRLKEYGAVDEVLPHYQSYISEINKMSEKEKADYKKKVLKEQEHSLLQEFKLVDYNFKKFKAKGKVIKSVKLINNNGSVKEVLFNFDLTTFAFGFIPSLFRKRYEASILIFLAQLLNMLIVPFAFSIITNFIITAIAAVFTGKNYIDYLIENSNFLPYDIWASMNSDYNVSNIRSKFKKQRKNKWRNAVISTLFFALTMMISLGYTMKDNIVLAINKNNNQMQIKDYMLIMTSNKNGKTVIDNILFINSKGNTDIEGIVYPGKIQVKLNNEYDELNKLVSLDDIKTLNTVLKSNFNINPSGYLVLDSDTVYNKNNIIEGYSLLISEFLSLDKKEFKDKQEEILEKYRQLDEEKLLLFYEEFSEANVNISMIKYDEVLLSDVVEEEILKKLNLLDKANYKFLTIDKRNLTNNVLVKDINKRYEEYLAGNENIVDEAEVEAEVDFEDLYIDESPNNNWQEDNGWEEENWQSDNVEEQEQPPVQQPPVQQPPVQQPPVQQPPVQQPPVEQPPVEQPPVEQPPVEQPPVEQPPVENPPVEEIPPEVQLPVE